LNKDIYTVLGSLGDLLKPDARRDEYRVFMKILLLLNLIIDELEKREKSE
jgi:hypothetical protein